MITIDGWREPAMFDTIVVVVGKDDETGEIVEVACDHRPGRAIIEAVRAGEEVKVDPEPWAILSRRPVGLGDYVRGEDIAHNE